MRASSRKVYVSRVVVDCISVPYDMMRYDNCVPDSEADAHKLERLAGGSLKPEDRRITFRRFAASPGEPTTGRWPGFGGKVISWEYIS